jgi:predicted secreted protein
MAWTTMLAIYFIFWWLSLFLVLPWGARSQHESGEVVPGTEPGAPVVPRMASKLGWTTLVAGVLFASFYVVYTYRLITVDGLDRLFGIS